VLRLQHLQPSPPRNTMNPKSRHRGACLALCTVAWLLATATAAAATAAAPPPQPPAARLLTADGRAPIKLPLSTRGRIFVDTTGARVRLRCASWSGMQEKWYVPSGLWARHRRVIAGAAAAASLNCLRIVWSLEAVVKSSNGTAAVPAEAVAANPDLVGKGPLEVLDAVIAAAWEKVGLLGDWLGVDWVYIAC
jgi:endoglucanase